MNQQSFNELAEMVIGSKLNPPANLFANGFGDWHCRARLAHFLAMPEFQRTAEAIDLLKSVEDQDYDDENSQDVEEMVFAMQKLSQLEKEDKATLNDALNHIGKAIEIAENTDFLYRFILRGELWGDRWNLMHKLNQTRDAEAEADERIEVYKDIPVAHNSYLYYAYRFKAMLSAERGVTLVAKDYMHMAIHSMEIPEAYEAGLERAFASTHDNASWILNEVDRATPNPDHLHWDI